MRMAESAVTGEIEGNEVRAQSEGGGDNDHHSSATTIGITLIALQVAILWAVEAGYWLFCKATGRRY
jgi:hypothetical protein